jgi:hypothetical protein
MNLNSQKSTVGIVRDLGPENREIGVKISHRSNNSAGKAAEA